MIFTTLLSISLFYLSATFACNVTIVRTNKENTKAYFSLLPGNKKLQSTPACTSESALKTMQGHVASGESVVLELPLKHNPNVLIILDSAFYSGNGALTWMSIDPESVDLGLPEDTLATFIALLEHMKDGKLFINKLRRLNFGYPAEIPARPPSRHQGGIINLGATCYMNASLQALWNTPVFHFFFWMLKSRPVNNTLVKALNVIFESMDKGKPASQSQIEDFIGAVRPYTGISNMKEQNDSQEFIDGLLDGLAQAFRSHPLLPNSGIDKMFYSELEEVTSCRCGFNKHRRIAASFIEANLRQGDPDWIDLSALLDRLLLPDEIKDNRDHQNPEHDLTRRLLVHTLPCILIIQINRKGGYQQSAYGFNLLKLNQNVSFPIDGLDMTRYVTRRDGDLVYDLVSIITHTGNIGGGHYTAYLRRGNEFVYANDDAPFQRRSRAETMGRAMTDAVELIYQLRGTIAN